MKHKVQMYLGGKVFDEYVEARNYQDARLTASARNPSAKVMGVTAVFGHQNPDHPDFGKKPFSSRRRTISPTLSKTHSGDLTVSVLMGLFSIFKASCNKWGVKNTLAFSGGIFLFLTLIFMTIASS
tara:strand:- start:297 stop:674 length:378 start_codon:yes stop_codon:yes gene_type:complete